MITSLPLNESSIYFINRDIALFLGFLFVVSLSIRLFRVKSTRFGLKHVLSFLKDSTWEIGLIFVLRSFFYEMYIIPSSSMQPSVYPGDVILVNKYTYGMKIPGTNITFFEGTPPQRGDVVVFLDPQQPTVRKMIKRVIGLPGDHLLISKHQVIINGVAVPTQYHSQGFEYIPSAHNGSVRVQTEIHNQKIDKHTLAIQRIPVLEEDFIISVEVPQGSYFVMGDNRENSKDSRYIGYVPERFLCGQAQYVVMSFGKPHGYYEWSRLGVLP